jgi:choline dehydrogenase-like flavoprotein
MFQFGRKTVFTRDIPHELGQAGYIAVYLYANVTEIETDETGKTATRVKVACLGDKQFYVAARHFVLATGGTENARILLLSDRVQPTGLGNRHDLVGRFFNVHPQFHHDRLTPVRRDLFSRARLYDLRSVNQVMVMGRLGLARAVMEKEQLRNLGVMLLPREEEYWSKEKEKANSKRTKPASKPSVLPAGLLRIARSRLQSLGRLVAYLPNVSKTRRRALPEAPLKLTLERGGWSNLPDVDKRYATFEMVSLVEQAPDPANRVMLGLERDPLGARRLELHWRWSESDHKQVLRSRSRIGHELARSGLGTFELVDAEPKHPDSSHHIGTTRMHHDPRFGVVDANCRVHGVANLFVAGSSVFPTGGFANPTLTIVALAARLAEHIKKVCLGFAQD